MVIKKFKKLTALLFMITTLLTYSCAPKYNTISPDSLNIEMEIKPGDNVKITTKDQNEYEFEVVEITDDAIVGETEKVQFDDIQTLQEMAVSSEKQTFKVIGGVALIILYVGAGLLGAAAGASPNWN